MAYSFDDAQAAERHETQYFEMFVNRGIYHKGWTAVTRHSTPFMLESLPVLTMTCGNCTARRIGRRLTTSPKTCPKSCITCSACS